MNSIISQHLGHIGLATLNRPTALNTLNTEMVCSLYDQLQGWFADPSVSLIILQGAGEKAFCAGGDVKAVALEVIKEKKNKLSSPSHSPQAPQSGYADEFFSQEYRLDQGIHHSPKPILVIGHGITMGGGIGLLAGASCRVVTETSILAMPEISIGFFPDVGASYFLSRMPDHLGLFLALTAYRFNARDAIDIGLADAFLPQVRVPELIDHLEKQIAANPQSCDPRSLRQEIKSFSRQFQSNCPEETLKNKRKKIQEMCSGETIQEIYSKMAQEAETFPAVQGLLKGSPTSAALILEQLKRGATLTLDECFEMELRMAVECCRQNDFLEGVRAVLIDKDQKPKWQPGGIDDVNSEYVQSYFTRSSAY